MKKFSFFFRRLAIALCLLIVGCTTESPPEELPNLELPSIVETYDDALAHALAWNVDAKLVSAEQKYNEIHGEIFENVINYRFEVHNNYEEAFVIRCAEVGCEGGPKPIEIIGEEVLSFFGKGLEPIDINTITIDSSDALNIADKIGHFEFHSEDDSLSFVLTRNFETGTLEFIITNASRYSGGGWYYSSVTIDPTNGSVLRVSP
jgi:hypothetical protein